MTSAIPLSWSGKFLCVCGCGAFFAAAYFVNGPLQPSQADTSLETTLHEIDQQSPGWRLAELEAARPAVPDEDNSAPMVERAARMLLPELSYGPTRRLVYGYGRSPDELDPLEAQNLQHDLSLRENALAAALLIDKPRGRHSLVLTDKPWALTLSHAVDVSQIVYLLTLHAVYCSTEGDQATAEKACRAAFNVVASLGDEPFLVSQLMRKSEANIAARAVLHQLDHGVVADKTLVEFQTCLEAEADHPAFLIGLRSQRALIHAMLTAVEEDRLPWGQLFPEDSGPWATWFSTPDPVEVRHQHAALLLFCGRVIDAAKLAPAQRKQQLRDLQTEVNGNAFPLLASLVRDLPYLEQRFGSRDAQLRCAATAVAAERYRLQVGRWPAALAELTPAYLKAVPLDPADGEPLRYEHFDDGVAISSRCLDDRGRRFRTDDPTAHGGVGVRLWDVSQRNRPRAVP